MGTEGKQIFPFLVNHQFFLANEGYKEYKAHLSHFFSLYVTWMFVELY